MTFDASTFRPTRKPSRKTAAAASAHTGQSGRDAPRRPRRAGRSTPAARQVDERRVGERDAPEDLAAVEEPERDREREQREQVEVAQREQAAPVGEPEQEGGAEREPDGRAVDLLAAERAAVAARHLPGHLRARPRLGDDARLVVDLALGDLSGLARPDCTSQARSSSSKVASVVGSRRVAVEPVAHLLLGAEGARGARSRSLGRGSPRPAARAAPRPGRRCDASRTRRRQRRGGHAYDERARTRSTGAGTTRACCR